MANERVRLSVGKPKVVLPAPDPGLVERIEAAEGIDDLAAVVADHPESMDAWAALGECQEAAAGSLRGAVQAYASFRIGYHRGLDALRRNGWSGTQLVRWTDESNRGFLRCLAGLQRMAGRIGESDEEARCGDFLRQLDPDWPPVGG